MIYHTNEHYPEGRNTTFFFWKRADSKNIAIDWREM